MTEGTPNLKAEHDKNQEDITEINKNDTILRLSFLKGVKGLKSEPASSTQKCIQI